MSPLEDLARQKAFSDRVSAVFREVFGEAEVQLLGGKFDVFSVAAGLGADHDTDLVVVGLRLSAQVRRRRVLIPGIAALAAARGGLAR